MHIFRGGSSISCNQFLHTLFLQFHYLSSITKKGEIAKDGAVSLDEAVKAAGDRFDRMDRTKDGTLDRADRDALVKEMADYRVKRILHRFGATAEGKITREQAFKVAGEMFARLDRNSDGTISRGERPRWGRHGGGHERRM
jgi:Ca2+-binding EF-hand superfamily protein